MNNAGMWDAGERTAWTVAETALALTLARAGQLPPWIIVLLAGVLAAVKTATALRYGNGSGALFLPRRVEPRPPETGKPPA